MANQNDIKSLCEKEWERWKYDCSGFLKAVAADLGVTLAGQANGIIDAMSRAPWTQLGTNSDKAVNYASMGYFVVAGLKATHHGHVVIIVPGSSQPYPTAYWGQLGGAGKKNTTINWSFGHRDLPNVQYFAIRP